MSADLTAETDLDQLAKVAYELSERVRDDNPVRVRRELELLCHNHPVRAAQLLMVFAVWFDPDTTTKQLQQRVDSVARSRVLGRSA